jgi:hypothetical protein
VPPNVQQQREATATGMMLAWPCCKQKEGGSGTIFSKKKLFQLQIYTMLNTTFLCEIFSFDAVLYFLHYVTVNWIIIWVDSRRLRWGTYEEQSRRPEGTKCATRRSGWRWMWNLYNHRFSRCSSAGSVM